MFAALLAVFLVMPLGAALAHGSDAKDKTRVNMGFFKKEWKEKNKEALEKWKNGKFEKSCKNIETRLDTRIKRYENNRKMHEKVFENMIARLKRLSDKMKEKGADVDKLDADIKTLNEKIDKLLADHDAFIKTLKDSRSETCDKNNDRVKDEFKSKIGEARKQIETIRKDRMDIRDFYKTAIKSDLADIKKQLEDQKSDAESDQ